MQGLQGKAKTWASIGHQREPKLAVKLWSTQQKKEPWLLG